MINRYLYREVVKNSQELYEKTFEERNVKFINQYESPTFVFPEVDALKKINTVEHIWSAGDRYYKLAKKYYGDPVDWWVIARFNNRPTESHNKVGDIILIPTPLYEVLNVLRG